MTDNCDMNLFDPEKMEIKPGKVSSFIPEYSKLIVSARSDSTYCIEFEIAGRAYEFEMSKEQAVKLACGILTLSGEERPQGKWIKQYGKSYELKTNEGVLVGEFTKCPKCQYDKARGSNFCPNCGADMRKEVKKNEIR